MPFVAHEEGGGSQNLQQVTDVGAVTTNEITLPSFQLDTTRTGDTIEGQIAWNEDKENIVYGIDSDSIEMGISVDMGINQTGSTITKGMPVCAVGAIGASGKISIAPFIANGSIPNENFIGFAHKDILNGNTGVYITNFARIRGLNTNAWTAGTKLYPSATTAGQYQTTAPSTWKTPIAQVINQHTTNGVLAVRYSAGLKGSDIVFDMTEGSVPFVDSNKNLVENNTKFNYQSSDSVLSAFNTTTELVANGTFTGSSSGWYLGSGFVYSANSVSKTSNGTATLIQANVARLGLMCKFTYTLSNVTAGTVTPSCGGITFTTRSANGTYTEYFTAINNAALTFSPSNTARFTIDNVSILSYSNGTVKSGNIHTNQVKIHGNTSHFSPGSTRHISLTNDGLYTWIDAYFGNNLRGAIGFDSGGTNQYHANYSHNFYTNTSTSPILSAFLTQSQFGMFGVIGANTALSAGSLTSSQPSTLNSWGSIGFKHTYISQNTTLDLLATYIDADPDNASFCTGTPTYSCSSYTTQGNCETRNSHGGCVWNSVDCSVYSGNTSACSSAGCTVDTSECSGASDESSCLAQDDTYGGSCSWSSSTGDCSGFDEGTCNSTSGCSVNYDYCSNYSDGGGDGTACGGVSSYGCSYDSGTGTCSGGGWFTSCSGSYSTYSCTGTYNNGNCSGSGGTCSGTANCANISAGNCSTESGCTYIAGLAVTMPSHAVFSTNFLRTYYIKNIGTTNNVTVYPNTSQTINKTTSITIAPGKSRHVSFAYHTVSCNTWDNTNSGVCDSKTGCSYTNCSGLDQTGCEAAGRNCVWDSDNSICNGNGNCDGQYTVIRDWSIYGGVF